MEKPALSIFSFVCLQAQCVTGPLPFAVSRCTVCDRAFSRSGILQNHMKVHTGEKAYECTVCNKRFSRSALLTWHSRIHTGVKPYQCSLCGKVFRLSGVLRTHMRRLHSTEMASLQLTATDDHDSSDGTTSSITLCRLDGLLMKR